jgi:hypothetical protein
VGTIECQHTHAVRGFQGNDDGAIGVIPFLEAPHLVSRLALVEREALVRAFSPSSTLEPGLKVFRRRGSKCWLETL